MIEARRSGDAISPTDLIHEFVTAFNSQDVPALLACFTGDAVYHDNFYGRYAGQAGLALLQLGLAPESLAKILARRLPA